MKSEQTTPTPTPTPTPVTLERAWTSADCISLVNEYSDSRNNKQWDVTFTVYETYTDGTTIPVVYTITVEANEGGIEGVRRDLGGYSIHLRMTGKLGQVVHYFYIEE